MVIAELGVSLPHLAGKRNALRRIVPFFFLLITTYTTLLYYPQCLTWDERGAGAVFFPSQSIRICSPKFLYEMML